MANHTSDICRGHIRPLIGGRSTHSSQNGLFLIRALMFVFTHRQITQQNTP